LTLLAGGGVAALTMSVTWSASPASAALARHVNDVLGSGGIHQASLSCLGLGGALALLSYLMDLPAWSRYRCARVLCAVVATSAFLVGGFVFLLPTMPSVPVFFGALWMCLAARAVRAGFLGETACERSALYGSSAAFLAIAGGLFSAWWLWLSTPAGSGQFIAGLRSEKEFVRTWCPFMLGVFCCIISMVVWMRASLSQRFSVVWSGGGIPLPPQVQLTVVVLTVSLVSAWIAVSVSVESAFLSGLILRTAGLSALGTLAYLADWVGRHRAVLLVERSTKLRQARMLLTSDWCKGLMVLPAVPALPIIVLVDAMHQAVRRSCQSCSGLPDFAIGKGCFTLEATWIMEEARNWEWSSVLTKSMYLCIAHFSVQVGVSQGLVLFLAWFNELVQPWPFLAASSLLFVVEILLFLFPPVAGIPLYMIGGIVIIPKVVDAGFGFWAGIAAGTTFCFALKLLAVALEQKAIGEPFASSVAVKKFIGVHTPFMKAVRLILSQRGFSAAKVAVLVGGPDWPTSVVTGIMGLPLGEMLLGTVPVVLLIFPVLVSAGFKLESARQGGRAALETVANLSLVVSTLLQVLASTAAAYYAQVVMDEFGEEFSAEGSSFQRDPQEREVMAALEVEATWAREWTRHTCWQVQPLPARALLLTGACLSSATVLLVVNPFVDSFKGFTITDKVSELPGGVFSIVLPPGWAAIYSLCAVLVCLTCYQTWCWTKFRCHARRLPREIEMAPTQSSAGCS